MARVHQSSEFPDHTFHNHDQQPKQTYSRGRGRGRGENVAFNCWECGEPVFNNPVFGAVTAENYIKRLSNVLLPLQHLSPRGNRASSSDPSKADAKDTTSGTPKVRAKSMKTSTEVSVNAEPVKAWLPQKNDNISLLQATIEQKEKELQLCGQKIDTLNSQLNKATTDLKCARAKNEDMAFNVNCLQQELEKRRKELSSLKDKDEAWAHKYRCLNEDMALNVKTLEQQLEKYKKELSSLKEKDAAWAHKYQCLNEDKALNVKRLEQQLEKYKKELSSLKDKDAAWAHKYRCLNEDKALNLKRLEQQLEKYKKQLSSLKDKDEAWAHKYRCLNADNALNVKTLEQQLVKCKKELSSLKEKDEAWAHKYQCLNEDMALKVKRLEQQLEKYKKELSSLKDKDEAWSKKYWCLNEDMAGNMNVLEQQLEKCNKEISYLKDKNEAWLHKYWAKNWWGMNEDMALNVNSLEEELEQCRKELTCLKDNDEAWARKYRCLNEDMALDVKRLEQTLEKYKKELSSLKIKDEAWARKYRCLNEDKALNVKRLEQQLEKCKKELSSLKDKDEAWVTKLWALNKEFEETKHELNEKIKHLEEANETADDEISMQKLETEEWRKSAKAIASVLVGNAELCSKTPELESFVLYYTNRAAKRMSLKKFRKAMDDCKMATYLDPGSLKAHLIAGNCHLVVGEIDEALCCYKKCLDCGMVCFDRRLTLEASDGLQNAEKVVNLINQSTELLQLKSFESATHALEIITEALSISCYSEKLLELKGEALFLLQKYEEVVELCEQTLAIAEKNCTTTSNSDCVSDEDRNRLLNCWRLSLMSRSYFCMAKFDMALATLDKYEQLAPPETMTKGPSPFSAATVRELLRLKSAGNDAYQTGKYREAVEHYSNAIMRSIESRHFTAVCLCNRAAAHQALGNVIDAIADCNLAIALDGDYMKAISRRANLHEKIRDYKEAALDLQMLVCRLEKRSEKKHLKELTIARRRLSSANSNVKKGMTMDLYLILGLKGSESGSEIKKAYHKAALKHHPDKAGKFLARSESGAEGDVLKEIFTTIQKDADKLFKIIGEAYAVLSDANKHVQGTTSRELWLALEHTFAPNTISREYTLKSQLLKIQMQPDESSSAYLTQAREYATALANIGEPFKEKDVVMLVVAGLRAEYDGLKTNIMGRQLPTPFSDIYAILSDHDYMVKKSEPQPVQAFNNTCSSSNDLLSPLSDPERIIDIIIGLIFQV
ncbi:dnaJ domain, Zinc finger, CCHC-type, Tetratricopeptide-like helical domain protein [Artemisia annua]|uniref:DnaJ domain, Zinc finger, CCHC-type, Tetratricopeptide-like helical domain protein n=1 Tax=Artemisia annua TaxID=35608 RepID=A0A2U1MGJ8_ARTAN|nr:dnaJ domain, Zinc finger, CCHC-type, Tetratricopeptide-like helical domain protein [Artemisia annua]